MPNCSTIARMQGIQTISQIAVQNSLHPSGIKCVKHVTHLDGKSKFSQLMFFSQTGQATHPLCVA
jgi:hypothetical protein